MGQATVDLPDPLEPQTVSAANTDELLAQLAGEEIDRLLAEADAEPTPAPAQSSPTSSSPHPDLAPNPSAAITPGSERAVAAQLDDLFAQLTQESPEAPAAAAAAPDARQDVAQVAPATAFGAEDATTSAERGALNAASGTGAAPAEDLNVVLSRIEDIRLPFYLRPLEWLSAPLNACPEHVRDVIGKIAIVTAVNALAVLAYVLFFRRHG